MKRFEAEEREQRAADEIDMLRRCIATQFKEHVESAALITGEIERLNSKILELKSVFSEVLHERDSELDRLQGLLDTFNTLPKRNEAKETAQHILNMWRAPWSATNGKFIDRLERYVKSL